MTATTVLMSGTMRKRFGRSFTVHLDTKSPREAFRALAATVPGFRAFILGAQAKGLGFAVWRGRGEQAENLSESQLDEPAGDVVRIAPMLLGAKSGVFSIVLGAVLIAAGAYFHIPYLVNAGIAMAAGGVVQMLTPIPKLGKQADSADNQSSNLFNGPVNTTAQGNCAPLVYGKIRAGSAVVSAGMSSEDYVPNESSVDTGTDGGSGRISPYLLA